MKDQRVKPKRSTNGHQGVPARRPEACSKCGHTLVEGKYHDCGKQLTLELT